MSFDRLFRKEFRKGHWFYISDSIDIVKEKVSATADVVEQSLEKSQEFAGEVLDSTATLASQKLEKGKEFAESVHQKVHQLASDKATLAGEVKDAVVDKSQAGAEAFQDFVTGILIQLTLDNRQCTRQKIMGLIYSLACFDFHLHYLY